MCLVTKVIIHYKNAKKLDICEFVLWRGRLWYPRPRFTNWSVMRDFPAFYMHIKWTNKRNNITEKHEFANLTASNLLWSCTNKTHMLIERAHKSQWHTFSPIVCRRGSNSFGVMLWCCNVLLPPNRNMFKATSRSATSSFHLAMCGTAFSVGKKSLHKIRIVSIDFNFMC